MEVSTMAPLFPEEVEQGRKRRTAEPKPSPRKPDIVQWGLEEGRSALRQMWGAKRNWPEGALDSLVKKLRRTADLAEAQDVLEKWMSSQSAKLGRLNAGQVERALQGPVKGKKAFGAFTAETWFMIRMGLISHARAVMTTAYEEWETDPVLSGAYERFVRRLGELRADECPLTLAFRFEQLVSQGSFTDYRRRFDNIRSIRRRHRRVERGEIKSETQTVFKRGGSDEDEAERSEDPFRFSPTWQPAPTGGSCVFPETLDEASLDALCEWRGFAIGASSWEGQPAVELYRPDGRGSTAAVYLIEDNVYRRAWPVQGR